MPSLLGYRQGSSVDKAAAGVGAEAGPGSGPVFALRAALRGSPGIPGEYVSGSFYDFRFFGFVVQSGQPATSLRTVT